jgi:peroxiredoxin
MKSIISICIPINLKNRREIAAALEERYSAEYVFIGRVFQSTITQKSCAIDIIGDREGNLAEDFQLAAQDKLDLATIGQINHCPLVIYLTSTTTGLNACQEIAKFAQILLQIGGIAIKVESAGIAHHQDQWLAHHNSQDVFEIYSLFVMLIEGEDYYYSCGMHNFGKADVAIAITEDLGLAIYVMNVFNYYRLTESPILQDGHIFQPDVESPRYQIEWMIDRENVPDSYQHNPHGRWCLQQLDQS